MWKPSDGKMPQRELANTLQTPISSLDEVPGTPAQQAPLTSSSQPSTIGKSIVIKGEIAASEPFYIYGSIEGSINVPAHRVTIGREGKVKADINAREVVIMGEVDGNLKADRVEIRRDGSLTGDLVSDRVSIEEGAYLSGAIVVRKPNVEAEKNSGTAGDRLEQSPATEPELDRSTWANFAAVECV